MDSRTVEKPPRRRGAAEGCSSDDRTRCAKQRGPDAGLNFPEGRAYQHLEGLFLGQIYYLR